MWLYKGVAYLVFLESVGVVHGDDCEITESLHDCSFRFVVDCLL